MTKDTVEAPASLSADRRLTEIRLRALVRWTRWGSAVVFLLVCGEIFGVWRTDASVGAWVVPGGCLLLAAITGLEWWLERRV